MKKSNIEHIKDLISYGHEVLVEQKGGDLRILNSIMPNGNLQGTCPGKDEGECRRLGWSNLELRPKEIENDFTDNYKIVTQTPKKYLNGQKVDILEIAREAKGFEDWSSDRKEMVGQKGLEVKNQTVEGSYSIYTKDKTRAFIFPHWCLAPHKKEEPLTLLKDGKKYEVQIIRELE